MPTGWYRSYKRGTFSVFLYLPNQSAQRHPISIVTRISKLYTRNRRLLEIPYWFYIRYGIEINALFILTTLLCKSLKLKVSSCSWTNDVLFLAPFKFHATLKFTILLCLFFHSKMGFITIVKMKNASFRIVQFCVLIFYCS